MHLDHYLDVLFHWTFVDTQSKLASALLLVYVIACKIHTTTTVADQHMQARLSASPRKQKACGPNYHTGYSTCDSAHNSLNSVVVLAKCVAKMANPQSQWTEPTTADISVNKGRSQDSIFEALMTLNNFFACVMSCFTRRCAKDLQVDVGNDEHALGIACSILLVPRCLGCFNSCLRRLDTIPQAANLRSNKLDSTTSRKAT